VAAAEGSVGAAELKKARMDAACAEEAARAHRREVERQRGELASLSRQLQAARSMQPRDPSCNSQARRIRLFSGLLRVYGTPLLARIMLSPSSFANPLPHHMVASHARRLAAW
jgi:hypothetical protein